MTPFAVALLALVLLAAAYGGVLLVMTVVAALETVDTEPDGSRGTLPADWQP